MPRPRIRIMLPTTKTTTAPHQPSLLHQYTTSPSPLHPLSPRLKSPASAHSASTPLSGAQPQCLHHQDGYLPLSPTTFLPSPRQRLPPPPRPSSPLPWTWRCHMCHTAYRLGTTRRCLIDGHYFCSAPPPPPPESPSPSPSPSPQQQQQAPLPLSERRAYQPPTITKTVNDVAAAAPTQLEQEFQQRKHNKRDRVKKSRASKTCSSSFDYHAWADWNTWRREVHSSSSSPIHAWAPTTIMTTTTTTSVMTAVEMTTTVSTMSRPTTATSDRSSSSTSTSTSSNDPPITKYRRDCFTDCDFPSECSWFRTREYLEAVQEVEAEEEAEEEKK